MDREKEEIIQRMDKLESKLNDNFSHVNNRLDSIIERLDNIGTRKEGERFTNG